MAAGSRPTVLARKIFLEHSELNFHRMRLDKAAYSLKLADYQNSTERTIA